MTEKLKSGLIKLQLLIRLHILIVFAVYLRSTLFILLKRKPYNIISKNSFDELLFQADVEATYDA